MLAAGLRLFWRVRDMNPHIQLRAAQAVEKYICNSGYISVDSVGHPM
jgi:hypothetical protein